MLHIPVNVCHCVEYLCQIYFLYTTLLCKLLITVPYIGNTLRFALQLCPNNSSKHSLHVRKLRTSHPSHAPLAQCCAHVRLSRWGVIARFPEPPALFGLLPLINNVLHSTSIDHRAYVMGLAMCRPCMLQAPWRHAPSDVVGHQHQTVGEAQFSPSH